MYSCRLGTSKNFTIKIKYARQLCKKNRDRNRIKIPPIDWLEEM